MNPVQIYHLCALRGAIRLEQKGLRRRGRSAKSIAIEELKLKKTSTHEEVIAALTEVIDSNVSFEDLGKGTD